MQTKYKYKDKTYTHIYPLSEALGKEGIFIPLSISLRASSEIDRGIKIPSLSPCLSLKMPLKT